MGFHMLRFVIVLGAVITLMFSVIVDIFIDYLITEHDPMWDTKEERRQELLDHIKEIRDWLRAS